MMLTNGLSVAGYSRWIGWSFALVPAFTSFGTALPLIRYLGPAQRVGAFVAGVQVLVIVGSALIGSVLWRSAFASLGV